MRPHSTLILSIVTSSTIIEANPSVMVGLKGMRVRGNNGKNTYCCRIHDTPDGGFDTERNVGFAWKDKKGRAWCYVKGNDALTPMGRSVAHRFPIVEQGEQ
ncbi:hypothetical protein HYFRA_00005415 [Hymenoscyphus fraxineus]|uniref:Uncharacterized protein n=1 Tax=Hymenoscyphus fraxineus TaxID=746836 RepID=A0A9N9KT39_9HELO|nr:hypothetical protein HYFRA_00005415 [Hymenoscyphus fraxineus]